MPTQSPLTYISSNDDPSIEMFSSTTPETPRVVSGNITEVVHRYVNTFVNNTYQNITNSPGGAETEVQFKHANTFTGDSGMTYNYLTDSLTVTGNVVSGAVKTDSLQYANGVAWVFPGTYTNANVAAMLPTYSGNISANVITANLSGHATSATVASSANAVAGGNVSGQVGNAAIAGTVYTNAQPNITSVGTLSALSVTGNVDTGNVSGTNHTGTTVNVTGQLISTVATGTAPLVVSSTTVVANLNAATAGLATYATTANAVAGGNVSGKVNSAALADAATVASSANAVAGGNVSGQVGNAAIAGTVYTNAQPNITSVGTLTDLTVGNVTANVIFGNGTITATGNISAGNVSATTFTGYLAGPLTTNAQPNITSVGTLTGLTVSGNISAGNVSATGLYIASINAAVSANGADQANAAQLTNMINFVTSVSTGTNEAVKLPTAAAGLRITVQNTSANVAQVFPGTGGTINILAADAAFALSAGSRAEFIATSSTQWYT